MNLSIIDIPFGKTNKGESVSIPLYFPGSNHCFINGAPGSGKSVFLKVIIDSIDKNYDSNKVIVWTDYFAHNYERCPYDSVIEVCLMRMNPEERMFSLINELYVETQKRLQILYSYGVSSFLQVEELPVIIAVIDDFYPIHYSDHGRDATEKLRRTLLMSHVVGISIVCTSQMPISRINGCDQCIADSFNLRIALRAFQDYTFEALEIRQATATAEIKEAIQRLSSGSPGDFLFLNRYEPDKLFTGRTAVNRWRLSFENYDNKDSP